MCENVKDHSVPTDHVKTGGDSEKDKALCPVCEYDEFWVEPAHNQSLEDKRVENRKDVIFEVECQRCNVTFIRNGEEIYRMRKQIIR